MGVAPRGRLRAAAANLALAAASVLVVFGGAEAALRLTGLAPTRALRSADARTLAAIPGLFEPGQEFTDRVRRDLPARIRINGLGFRGADMEERKPPGAFRVLALGDSYTFGDHVDDEDAYPARLESALRALRPGTRVEVVNAGVNGFGILDEAALWRRAGGRLDPDVVLITFTPNDVSDMTRPTPIIERMREHAEVKARPLVGPLLRLAQNTALFTGLQIAAARYRARTRSHPAIPEIEPARAGPEAAPLAWEAYRKALRDLGRELAGAGPRAVLVLYPSVGYVTGEDRPHASEILPGWADEAGLPCLDLLPAFREAAARGEVLYLVPRDSHPAAGGHAVAAETIARELDLRGWLPPRSAGAAAAS